ncbi:MAG TPA: cation:proton antiporter, partial [Roseiflexaceae bacterium]|nr:cation:proton antiporter [Roseiflexaceae bacterium]
IVGYLLAGMAIGPFTPGFVGDIDNISQLAELGVIFLMFGVGLHFSLNDLWTVRAIAIPGALLQMALATLLGFGLAELWGWSIPAGLILGFAVSIASTVVALRALMDNGLINSPDGQVVIGWLVLQDLATIVILVLMPAFFSNQEGITWQTVGFPLLKAVLFVGLMLLLGKRFLPWLLTRIAFFRSRELFILAVVAAAVGTALGSAQLFGVSLALGAFLAGVVLGESPLSHQIGAEVLPFREIFAVVFFVSVGMLVNPAYLVNNAAHVLVLTALIIAGKTVITVVVGCVLPASAHTMLVVAAGLSQIGEFSFILGQAGIRLGVLSQDQYSLILAGALLSIVLYPVLFRLIPAEERALQYLPWLWEPLNRQGHLPEFATPHLTDHVVIVGYGRVGTHVVTVLERLNIPHLVVEIDARRAAAFSERGTPTLYGDAANSELLDHAGLEHARALVVTLPNETATELVVGAAQKMAPKLPIIARAVTHAGVQLLTNLGARDVIHPEFEGGLEVVRHTLLALGYPATQVQAYTDAVRRDQYDTSLSNPAERHSLDQLRRTVRGMDIVWRRVPDTTPIVGQTLAEANLRAKTGASVIVIIRGGNAVPNPKSSTMFMADDLLGVLGDTTQIAKLDEILGKVVEAPNESHSGAEQAIHAMPM